MQTALLGLPLPTIAVSAEEHNAMDIGDIRAQIEALRSEQASVTAQQNRINAALSALEARLGAANAESGRASGEAGASAAGSAPSAVTPLTMKPRLDVSGDLRVRGQGDYSDRDGEDRNSSQLRGRLGASYAVNDRLSVGARLVTGDADDPNSTDAQLSNFDDDLQVSLDLAYVQLNLSDLKLYAGKVPQPFIRTDLVWDGDVNPQGVSGVFKHSFDGGTIRASSLFFLVDEQVSGPESTMLGAQLGYDSPALGSWRYDISGAYFDYRLGSVAGGDAGDFRTNLRYPDGRYRSDFNLGDVIVGATWSGFGDRWPVRMVADYVKNFGAATEADTGYGIELSLGRASKPGDWRLTYGRAIAETDSVFAAFSHDNLSIATNYKSNALTFDYVPFPKTTLTALWYHYRRYRAADAGPNDFTDSLDRLRLFFNINF
ncbi:MAG: putative porin [Gammaproteobacteria bacterium]